MPVSSLLAHSVASKSSVIYSVPLPARGYSLTSIFRRDNDGLTRYVMIHKPVFQKFDDFFSLFMASTCAWPEILSATVKNGRKISQNPGVDYVF